MTEAGSRSILAYLLYGDRAVYHAELAFSVGSARAALGSAPADDLEIVVLTDQPAFAYPVAARVIQVSPETMQAWKGPARYDHRIKVCALERLLAEPCERLALVDSDTYFVADPRRLFERIGPDSSVMHRREGPIAQDDAWRPLYADPAYASALAEAGLTPDLVMLNSGVIGLHRSQAGAAAEALAWLDAYTPRIPSFSIEQAAFSRVLGQRTQLATSEDLLVHYWGFERSFIHARLPEALARGDFARGDELGMPSAVLPHKLASRAAAVALGWSADARFGYLAWLEGRAAQRRGDVVAEAWLETAVGAWERAKQHGGAPRGLPELLGGVRAERHVPQRLRPRYRGVWA